MSFVVATSTACNIDNDITILNNIFVIIAIFVNDEIFVIIIIFVNDEIFVINVIFVKSTNITTSL
jgi:hypothetical protein